MKNKVKGWENTFLILCFQISILWLCTPVSIQYSMVIIGCFQKDFHMPSTIN